MEYKASLDLLAKAITAGVIILLSVIGYQNVNALMDSNGESSILLIHGFGLLFIVLVLGITFIFSPQKYSLTNDSFIIHRIAGDVKIKLNEILEVRLLTKDEMNKTIRTFGVGGLFGYFGKFYNSKLGHQHFYASKRENRTLILLKNDKKIIVTPDELNLADAINSKIIRS